MALWRSANSEERIAITLQSQQCSRSSSRPLVPPPRQAGRASTPCGRLRRCTAATFIGLPHGSRQLALTYDDGPNDPYTWRMMEVLERHRVKATFFLLGRFVQQKPEIVRALVAAGHAIGSHTWDHPEPDLRLRRRSPPSTRENAAGDFRCRPVSAQAISPAVWRATSQHRCASRGLWDCNRSCGVSPAMTGRPSPPPKLSPMPNARFAAAMSSCSMTGDIVESAADRSRSVEASDRILSRYLAEGYEFVTVPEMMGEAGISD